MLPNWCLSSSPGFCRIRAKRKPSNTSGGGEVYNVGDSLMPMLKKPMEAPGGTLWPVERVSGVTVNRIGATVHRY